MPVLSFRVVRSAALAGGLALSSSCATVPVTGRQQVLLVSEDEELRLGAQAFEEVLGKEKILNDPAVQAVVERVGRRIAAATGKTEYQWEFKVIDNDQMVNAFALPGGKVAVYTGILPILKDESGLAAVMGHEVAHAIARHGGERISTTMMTQTGLGVAGMVTGMASKDPNITNGVMAALGIGSQLGIELPFSRKQESEADRMGLEYMAKAGYDPSAARDLWVRMGENGGSKPPEFLSTHPSDATRVKQIAGWMPEVQPVYAAAEKAQTGGLPSPVQGPNSGTAVAAPSGVPPASGAPPSRPALMPSGLVAPGAAPQAPAAAPAANPGVPPASAPPGVPPARQKKE